MASPFFNFSQDRLFLEILFIPLVIMSKSMPSTALRKYQGIQHPVFAQDCTSFHYTTNLRTFIHLNYYYWLLFWELSVIMNLLNDLTTRRNIYD